MYSTFTQALRYRLRGSGRATLATPGSTSRRMLLACLSLCLCVTAFAQREVVIHFDLKNTRQQDTLTLSWGANNKSVTPLITTLSAIEVPDATLPLNEPRLVVLGIKGQPGGVEMLLAPGENVTVSGKVKGGSSPRLSKVKISGAAHQDEYDRCVALYRRFTDSIDAQVHEEYKDVLRLIAQSKESGDERAVADMYQTQHGKQYVERIIGSFHEKNELLDELVSSHKESFMGPLLMIRLVGRLSKDYRDLYDKLSDTARQSYYGREVKDEVYPPTLVGDIAPTVTVRNLEGNEKLLSFIHHNNRYLLLDFWASWCVPCHKEIPNLKRIYEQYHAKGLDIIGISCDHNIDDWKATLAEQGEPWCNYIDQTRQAITEYKVQYIPSIFILDREGVIIAEKLRGKELSDFIDKLFEKE